MQSASVFPVESIEIINRRLKDEFGLINDHPHFRLTWPDDEFETRLVNYTPEGLQLVRPEFRLVHKYRKALHGFWVLERLTEVNVVSQQILPETALSYEPIHHFFRVKEGQYVENKPAWRPIKFLVEQLLKNMNEGSVYTKYKHPNAGDTSAEVALKQLEELRKIEEYLFGEETNVGDALSHKWGIVVPRSYEQKKEA